jgi:hypothetical protein
MIPENFEIKKRLKPEQTIHFVLYPQNYFKIAEELAVRRGEITNSTPYFYLPIEG